MNLPNGKREWLPITPAEYHALDAWGSSAIKDFALGALPDFWARHVAKTKAREETDAMRMGRAFHAAMEGRDDWRKTYVRIPDKVEDDEFVDAINGAITGKSEPLKVGVPIYPKFPTHREYVEAHKQRAARLGLDWLADSEIDTVNRQVDAVYDNQECRDILGVKTDLLSEVACIYSHDSGEKCKALLDRVISTGIVDYKKTCERTPCGFARDALRRGYDRQLGYYCFVSGKVYACIISVTDEAPFEAHAWEIPAGLLRQRIEDGERTVNAIAQLRRMSGLDEVDSQGMPLSYHTEGWGTRLQLSPDGIYAA